MYRSPSVLAFSFLVIAAAPSSTAQAPANDECTGAIPLAIGTNPAPAASGNTYSNVGATLSAGFPAPCSTMNSDVFFSFTPAATGLYQIDTNTPATFTAGTDTDTVVAVYDSCTPTSELACDDDGGTGLLSQLTVGLVAGQTYLIRVADFGTSVNPGTFYVNVAQDVTTFAIVYSSPGGPGCIQIDIVNGPANGNYFYALTFNMGLFPNGYFAGIDIGLQELVDEFNAGFPFTGQLDGAGNITIGPACGLPSGLVLYSVALGFPAGTGYGAPSAVTAPTSYVIP